MKLLAPLLFGFFASMNAQAIPLGSYKAIDAYCTNPNYKYSKEEQDYIDTLKGIKGSCIDGKMTSPPCFEDFYIFTTATTGSLVTHTTDRPGVSCTTTTEITYTETPPSNIDILLGKTTSHATSTPDTEMSCGEDSAGNHLIFDYKQDGEFLLLIAHAAPGADCGDFIFKTKSDTNIPK